MELTAITYEVSDHIATITLDRPDALNSFDAAMAREMGVSKATLWYWFLRFRITVRRVALAPGDELEIKVAAREFVHR